MGNWKPTLSAARDGIWGIAATMPYLVQFGGGHRPRATLILLRVIPIPIHAIHPRQDFRHRAVKLRGDFAADAAVFEEAAGEGNVLDDGDLMLLAEFADFLRVQADAFGHDLRRTHRFAIVFQRDRNVRRVHNDDVGVRDFGKLLGFALRAATAAGGFDLLIAFGVLRFFLHFLLGHHQVAVGAPPLIPVIRGGNDEQAETDAQENPHANVRKKLPHARDIHRAGKDGIVQDFHHFVVGERDDEQEFDDGDGGRGRGLKGEYFFEAFDGVHAVPIGREGFGGGVEFILDGAGEQPAQRAGEHDRPGAAQKHEHATDGVALEIVDTEVGIVQVAEGHHDGADELAPGVLAGEGERGDGEQEHEDSLHFGAVGDLPFLQRFLEFPRCCLLCLFACGFAHRSKSFGFRVLSFELTAHELGDAKQIVWQAVEIIGHVQGGEVQGEAEHDQAADDFERKAFGEHGHLRHGAREHGEHHRDDEGDGDNRRGDLQRDDEDLAGVFDDHFKQRGAQVRGAHGQHAVGLLKTDEHPVMQIQREHDDGGEVKENGRRDLRAALRERVHNLRHLQPHFGGDDAAREVDGVKNHARNKTKHEADGDFLAHDAHQRKRAEVVHRERWQGGSEDHGGDGAERDAHGDGEIRGAKERQYEQKRADAQKHQEPVVILELQVHFGHRLQSKSGAKGGLRDKWIVGRVKTGKDRRAECEIGNLRLRWSSSFSLFNGSRLKLEHQRTRSLHHLRHFLNDGGGEFDEGADNPWQQQQHDADDGKRFRHERERLFVDACDGLKQADREANDHRDDEDRRSDGQRLVDHRLEEFNGEFGIHGELKVDC